MPSAFDILYGQKEEEQPASKGGALDIIYGPQPEQESSLPPVMLGPGIPLQRGPTDQEPVRLGPPTITTSDRSASTLGPFVRSVFDILSVGQYLSANMMRAATTDPEASFSDLLEAARQGVTFEQRGDYIDLVNEWFPDAPEWWRIATGLMLNILLDPTTYLSFGGTVPGKAGRALVRFAGKSLLPQSVDRAIFESVDRAVAALKNTSAGRWLTQTFSTRGRFADEELWRYYQQSRDEANYLINKAIEANVPLEEAVREIERLHGIPREVITDLIERPVYVRDEELIQTTLPLTRQVTESLAASPETIGRAEELIEEVFIKGGNLPPGYTREIGRIRTLQDVREAENLLLDLYMDHIADRLMSGTLGDVWRAYERPEVVEIIRNRQTTHPLWSEIRELAFRQLDAGGERLRGFPKEWADLWDTLRLLEDPEFHTTRIRTRTGPMVQGRLALEVTDEVPVREPYSLGTYTVEYPRLELQDQPLRDLFADWTRRSEERIATEIAEGIAISPFESDALNYVTHILDPKARQFIESARRSGREIDIERIINATVQHPSTRERTIGRNLSIREINELAQRGELIPGYKGKLLIDDPVQANLIRDVMSARSIAAARFIRQVVENPDMARPIAVAGPEFRELSKTAKERFGPLVEGYAFRHDIADALEEYIVKVGDPANINMLVGTYDRIMNIWKKYTLGFSPTWMMNNVFGNLWNGVLLAGGDPSNFAKGVRILMTRTGDVRGMSADEVIDLAERHGVMWRGLYGAEVERALLDAIRQTGRTEEILTLPTRPLFLANQGLENAARLGLFIDGLDKGLSPAEAAARVKKYLFDYSDLTEAERQIRRVVPFYTWMRKNIPLQVESLFTAPGRQAVLPKLYGAISSTQEPLLPGEARPEWMQEGVYPQVGMDQGVARFMSLRGVPLVDLLEMAQDPLSYWLSANPLVSAAAALQGVDLFAGRELDPTRGVTVLPGVTLPEPQAEALFSLAPPLQAASRVFSPYYNPLLPERSLAERALEAASGFRFYERSYPEDIINALVNAEAQISTAESRLTEAEMAGDESQVQFYRRMLEQAVADYLALIERLGVASSPARP